MGACISCGGLTAEVFNLGDFYLADFVDPGESSVGPRYPLRMMMCDSCTLLQVGDLVPRDAVIHERYGFFSGLNEQNQRDLAENAQYARRHAPAFPREWLDIGCNDGELLRNVPVGMVRVGVDPLLQYEQFWDRAKLDADELVPDFFDPDVFKPGQFDVVTSTAMFYALNNPSEFVEGVCQVLSPRGVWTIQMNYAPDMITNNTVDNIIHEHVGYYTVRSLQDLLLRFGLEIADVTYSDVKGGCFRVAVHHRGARPVHASVVAALDREWKSEVTSWETWTDWINSVRLELERTQVLLDQLAAQDRPAYCLGAGNRGGTLVQLLGEGLLLYAVERSPAKHGKVWTSAGIPIISEEQFRADNPSHALVSPWFFRENIVPRERAYLDNGGKLIFPLPKLEVVTA